MIKILPRCMKRQDLCMNRRFLYGFLGGCDEFGFALQKVCIKTHQTILITPK